MQTNYDYPGNLHRPYPTQVRIEVAQGCTRNCHFCGITTVGNSVKLMTKDTMDLIVEKFSAQTKRVDFELHGEPLLNPNIVYIVKRLRAKFKKLQITIISNTDVLTKINKSISVLLDLFDAGLNFYHADIYDKRSGKAFIDLLKSSKSLLTEKNIKAYNFYALDYNAWSYHGGKNKEIIVCDEHLLKNRKHKNTRKLHNYAGNLSIEQQSNMNIPFKTLNTKCAEPFKAVAIAYDGTLFACCLDFSKSLKLANIRDIPTIESYWQSDDYNKLRFLLNKGKRALIPLCSICSKRSFRVGLYNYCGPSYNEENLKKEFAAKTKLSYNQKIIKEEYTKNEIS